jgi:hypothetical protein
MLSFAFFPLTILLLAATALPAPPLINLKAGVINLRVMAIARTLRQQSTFEKGLKEVLLKKIQSELE